MKTLRFVARASALLALFVLGACGSPLVGLECKSGYERCGGACYDFRSDNNHCGGCDIACGAGEQCVEMMCRPGSAQPDGGDGGLDPNRDGGDAGRDGGDGGLDAGDGGAGDGGAGDGGIDAANPDASDASDARTSDADIDARAGDGGGDANTPDGSGADARTGDGSPGGNGGDGGPGDGGGNGGGDGSVTLPELCTGPASPEDCVCDLGELKCDLECVDSTTDRNNCGGCGIVCEPEEYCAAGICAPICAPPLTLCTDICVNLQENDAYCGSCTNACGVGAACIDGSCVGRAVGHIVLMGHDMSGARAPMRTMVGNAIFLVRGSPVRVLAFDENTTAASRAGVSAAIQTASQTLSRPYSLSTATAALVSAQLGSADVFVIESQHGATDQALRDLGASWSAALATFLFRGGVILVFDAGGTNAGTHQILEGAGLVNIDARMSIPRSRLGLVAPTDAIAAGVPTEYQSEGESAGFDVDLVANPAIVVVRDPTTMLPVVLHATIVD